MNYLIWNKDIMLKSFELLKKLRALDINFVLIGGWAVYFLTKYHMSRDIDIVIQDRELWKLRNNVFGFGGREKIGKLKKTGFFVEDVDIDVYSESQSSLIIPIKDIFEDIMYTEIDDIKTLSIEPLILLKLKAAESRKFGTKGLKDRCDIISLCCRKDTNFLMLSKLARKYKADLGILKEIIRNSGQEYNYAFQERLAPNKVKRIKHDILKNIQ